MGIFPNHADVVRRIETLTSDQAEVQDCALVAYQSDEIELGAMAAEAYITGNWSQHNARLSSLIQTEIQRRAINTVARWNREEQEAA